MKHTYETMLLLDNREVKKGWDTLKSDVLGLFTKHDAEVVSARRWDERRLAYPIKGQQRGTYLLVYHQAPTAAVAHIGRELRYSDPVLRSMTTTCETVPEEAYQPEAAFDPNAVPVEDEPVVEAEATETGGEKADDEAEKAETDDAPKAEAAEDEEEQS